MKVFRSVLISVSVLGWLSPTAAPAASLPDYNFVADIKLGPPGVGDYLTIDSAAKRLYVSHWDHVDVVDTATKSVVGSVRPFKLAHGVVTRREFGKGYVSDGEAGMLKEFDLSNLHITKEIKVPDDADGVALDPVSGSVLVAADDSKSLSIVDPKSYSVRTIALPGSPEFLIANQHGKVFVNITSIGAVSKVDIPTGHVEATWPLRDCQGLSGIAYDSRTDRLFSSCTSGRMIVIDAATGRTVASMAIGLGSDSVVADVDRGLVFSSNGDGTLSVVKGVTPDAYAVIRTIPTFLGGRNMAIDAQTGTLFIAHGNMKRESSKSRRVAQRFEWDGVNVARFEVVH